MKLSNKQLNIVSNVFAVIALVFFISAIVAGEIHSQIEITNQMYETKDGLKKIIKILSLENSRERLVSISELGIIFFLGLSVVMKINIRIRKLEKTHINNE